MSDHTIIGAGSAGPDRAVRLAERATTTAAEGVAA